MKSIQIIAMIALTFSLHASNEVTKKNSTFKIRRLSACTLEKQVDNIISSDNDTTSLIAPLTASNLASVSLNNKHKTYAFSYIIEAPHSDISSLSESENSSLALLSKYSSSISLKKPKKLSFEDHKNFIGFMYGIYTKAALTQESVQEPIQKHFAQKLEQEDIWNYSKYIVSTLNPEAQAVIRKNFIDGFECSYSKDTAKLHKRYSKNTAKIQITPYNKKAFELRKKTLEDQNEPFCFYA